MKRILSTALAMALLLGLGALAVLARPGGAARLSPVRTAAALAAPVAQGEVAAITTVTNKYSNVALPLDVTKQFADAGLTFNAQGLAELVGKSAVVQVLQWNVTAQNWEARDPNGGFGGNGSGTNFPLATNGVYFLLLNEKLTSTSLSLVGGVSDAGSVSFALKGTTPTCLWNGIILPLDQDSITTASALAVAIGKTSIKQMLNWNATAQNWESWDPNGGFGGNGTGTNFATKIGYPYWLCMLADKTWP